MDIGKNLFDIQEERMEALDNICLVTGVVSVGIGIYIFVTKKLVGRDTAKIPQDKIMKFLPYETATYILLGIFLALMGLGKQLPFFQKGVVSGSLIVLSIVIIGLNIHFANKILGKRR